MLSRVRARWWAWEPPEVWWGGRVCAAVGQRYSAAPIARGCLRSAEHEVHRLLLPPVRTEVLLPVTSVRAKCSQTRVRGTLARTESQPKFHCALSALKPALEVLLRTLKPKSEN
ncbi:hypothetical protein GCM10008097_11110 [Mycetocola manganoxydans]|nr:hypothetical protein GCM10008097_11110 [Mycetocola manganoxydans]